MTNYLRVTLLAAVALPISWITFHAITASQPPQHNDNSWNDSVASNHLQGGRLGPPPPRRGDDDRRPPPPREGGFGRPEEGPAGGRPPHRGGPGQPPPPHSDDHNRNPHDGRPPHGAPGGGREMEHLRQVDPEMAEIIEQDHELERKTYELAAAMRFASEEKQAEIRASLTEVVNEHFDIRQNRRKLELKRLENELTRLRQSIETRSKAREEIVKRRINEVLGDDKLQF